MNKRRRYKAKARRAERKAFDKHFNSVLPDVMLRLDAMTREAMVARSWKSMGIQPVSEEAWSSLANEMRACR